MTKRLRVVLDTNIFVSAFSAATPAVQLLRLSNCWQDGQFTLLVSEALIDELGAKLLERGIRPEQVIEFLALLERLAEWINVPSNEVLPVSMADPDDDHVVACSVVGRAHHLVTYDPHIQSLGEEYQGIRITKALPFLWRLRGDQPPE